MIFDFFFPILSRADVTNENPNSGDSKNPVFEKQKSASINFSTAAAKQHFFFYKKNQN